MSSTTDRAEIEVLFQKLARAHADHNADAIVDAYAPDAGQSHEAKHSHLSPSNSAR
ncbi:hypothetical protein SAMN04244571_04809 [Azotobacter beijerinckii]|uniref:SnoaL-like domain-containing protein n=1 Tax=Azotobacter beijerinckii TaxID=170623 RepID=A0A1I1CS49_9GAMM|nr:hypothetical protein SAMN04244571_04809 [Azotobacter beijerinckii]